MAKTKYRVTSGGVYGVNGELPVGFEFEAESVPRGLEGKVEELNGSVSKGTLVAATPDAGNDGKPDYSKLNVTELKALASDRQIDLGGATKKDDIIAKLQAADEDPKADIQPEQFQSSQQEAKVSREQLEKSAKTLDIPFDANTSDEDLYAKIQAALGEE